MLVGTRCLGLWALCVACSGSTTAATPNSPPPRSTEAKPSSSWVADSVARIRVDTGDAGGIRGCKGTLTPEARAFFTSAYERIGECVSSSKPAVKGSITFHSTLEEGGGLSEFAVLDDKLGAPDFVKCIQERVFTLEYPKVDPKTPCVQLVHPLTFE